MKDAPIVLLDETTSSLDADSEREVQKAFDRLMKDKTVLVIAHRLNTIEKADQILVMDSGKIRESGTHRQLLKLNGWYAHAVGEQRKAHRGGLWGPELRWSDRTNSKKHIKIHSPKEHQYLISFIRSFFFSPFFSSLIVPVIILS